MLAWMWRKRNTPPLLVGLLACTTTLEISLAVPQKIGHIVIRRVLTPGQEEHHRPESSAAKLYCLHLQEPECKRASPQMAKPHPFLRRIILHLGCITP